eukprot:7153034-Ditylum_brightwellii.AAC.1
MMPSTKRNKKDFHGSPNMKLMFVLEEWTDSMGKSRISVQLQVPAGSDSASKIDIRVSIDQRSLDLLRFKNWNKDAIGYALKNHAKTTARI